jgi:hypothetical protein
LLGRFASKLPRDGAEAASDHARRARRALRALSRPTLELLVDEGLAWACAVFDPFPERAWSIDRWRKSLRRLVEEVGEVDLPTVVKLTSRLSGGIGRRLLAGRAPVAELAAPMDLPGGRHRLRYLTRRRDPLTLMRFADAAPCCFSSDGGHFEEGMTTQRWVHRILRDPLSFCFVVERSRDSLSGPVGFVFGGFGLMSNGRPLLLLNGIYLRRQKRALRFSVLDAIETSLARPLGLRVVAIANQYGGYGPLPRDYAADTRSLMRLRALRTKGGALERAVYDDIGSVVNEEGPHDLWFKELDTEPLDTIRPRGRR